MAGIKTEDQVTPAEVQELLQYHPETGAFTWKPRPLKFCTAGAGRYTQERNKAVFDANYAGTSALTAHNPGGYLRGNLFGRSLMAHRAAFACVLGRWPLGQVDHINGVRDDNRWANLRESTNQQNQWNSSPAKGSSSQYVGVSWDSKSGKWAAYISPENKKVHLGYFECELEAAKARDKAAHQMFGDYARINLP